ncbi:hypothetical protein H2200_013173 [Cladophialophora chaetospira]|uniref:Uncharacterized protein n=1 Tax=Cladophialophora chaetospira TaxID=386627 RepID=A0AA38WWA4_9EURO|nr:hypothetical protein H2200_013173 [Cladophialophora chaetospira]
MSRENPDLVASQECNEAVSTAFVSDLLAARGRCDPNFNNLICIVASGQFTPEEMKEFKSQRVEFEQVAKQWDVGEELTGLIFELIALSSMDDSEPGIKKLRLWTTEMIMKTWPPKAIENGEIVEQEAVAGKLKDATETLLSGLKELCDDGTKSRQKIFDDISAESPSRKRQRVDENELEEKFKAVEELRRQWKAASEIGSEGA